ncbi:MAG: hypothetical protein K2L14_02345 [Duncaniella sp.]|nr:hypothetical protein [Duncaniella sp.]
MTRKILLLIGALISLTATEASAFDKTGKSGHFAWGAEIGPSIDLCGDDMSTIDLGGFLGWRNDIIDFAGIGAGINMVMSHSGRFFPVYAGFRSSFTKKKKLVFLDARIGCVFASDDDRPSQRVLYVVPGIGFNLASGATYQSYLLLNYSYCGLSFPSIKQGNEVTGVNRIGMTIGITF